MLKSIIQRFIFYAMKSRHLAHLIFKINFKPIKTGTYYFDMTTLVLTKLLLKEISKDDRILDMGTGSSSTVGLTLWKQCGCYVVCSDINPEIISMAQENIEYNHAPIQVTHSNLFENIEENFDIVVFNPPYVPTEQGITSNLSKEFQSQWDGGEDGDTIVKQFLDELDKIEGSHTAYLGINHFYLSKEKVVPIIETKNDLKLIRIYRHNFLPIDVFIIEKK
jgi:release factor glutamine methyltransferase